MAYIGPRPRWWLPLAVAGALLVGAGVAGYVLATVVAVVASAPAPRTTLPAISLPPAPSATSPSPSATPTATVLAASPSASPRIHVVQPGEYVTQIAIRYGVTPQAILEANDISDPNYIEIGQQLIIPDSP